MQDVLFVLLILKILIHYKINHFLFSDEGPIASQPKFNHRSTVVWSDNIKDSILMEKKVHPQEIVH